MFLKKFRSVFASIVLGCAAASSLSACTPGRKIGDIEGQFWQRTSMSEAVYAQGPKAQQMLNRDIARCVFEMRELERLGVTKNAIPTDYHGRVLDSDEMALYDNDSPERDGELFMEHGNYFDFETCMMEKGWERIEHVPFEVAAKGRENYMKSHLKYRELAEQEKQAKKATLPGHDRNVGALNE